MTTPNETSFDCRRRYRQIKSGLLVRVAVFAMAVYIVVESKVNVTTAAVWFAFGLFFCASEAFAYRHCALNRRSVLRREVVIGLGTLGFAKSFVYVLPAWFALNAGNPALIFAGVCFLCGALILQLLHRSDLNFVYCANAAPKIGMFCAFAITLSIEQASLLPVVLAAGFGMAIILTFLSREKILEQMRGAIKRAETERTAAEEAVIARSRFLAKMSHELRTPLNGIMGMADVLSQCDLSDEQRDHLDIIIGSGGSLLTMLDQILDHAKIEADHLDFDPQDEDLRDVVSQSIRLFQPQAIKKGVELSCKIVEMDTPYIHIDSGRLRQCTNNIISNAVKFTDSGHVHVRINVTSVLDDDPDRRYARDAEVTNKEIPGVPTEKRFGPEDIQELIDQLKRQHAAADAFARRGRFSFEDGGAGRFTGAVRVVIEVEDTGIGMSEDQTERIFDAFEQADNSITRRFGGTGLGLCVSRAIISAMGGEISVASKPGEGSLFRIEFIAETCAPPSAEEFDVIDVAWHEMPTNVLLVEDNPVNRRVFVALLKNTDAKITEAENGAIGVDLLKNGDFDIVFMDIHMPVMDGLSAMLAIRELNCDKAEIPIIALTAAVSEDDQTACRAAGANDILGKPVKAAMVMEMLEQYVWSQKNKPQGAGLDDAAAPARESSGVRLG